MERGTVRFHIPQPRFLDNVPAIVENPDEVIPVVVGRLGDPGDKATRLAARTIAFDLVPFAVVLEIVALSYRCGACHRSSVLGLG